MYGKLLTGCLENIVRYDSISVKVQKNIIHIGRSPLYFEALGFSLSSL